MLLDRSRHFESGTFLKIRHGSGVWYIQFQCIVYLHSAVSNNTTPAVSAPPQPSDNALIGVSVALAVLMTSVVGACVPVIVCVYFRSRHSRKETTERYVEYLHIYITFCIYSVGCNALRCTSVMHAHGGMAMCMPRIT